MKTSFQARAGAIALGFVGAVLTPAGTLLGQPAAPAAGAPEHAGQWQVIDSAFIGGQVLVQARIKDGAPAWFLLDTGSPITIVDQSLAELAKLEISTTRPKNAKGEEGGATRAAADVPLHLGAVDFTVRQLRVGNLDARYSKFIGRKISGVLGAAFFTQFVVELDYPAKRVRVHPIPGFVHDDTATILPMGIVSGLPVVLATATPVGSQPVGMLLLLDTGLHGALSVDPRWARLQGMPGAQQKTRRVAQMTPEESSEGTLFRVARFGLGSFSFDSVPATTGDHPIYRTVGAVGVLGSEVLSRFKVTIDYLRQRLILEPGPNQGAPFDDSLSGFGVVLEGETFDVVRIDGVDEGSPASQAGVKAGDVLLSVAGRATGQFAPVQLGEIFRESVGKPVALLLKRADKTVEVTLVPRQYE